MTSAPIDLEDLEALEALVDAASEDSWENGAPAGTLTDPRTSLACPRGPRLTLHRCATAWRECADRCAGCSLGADRSWRYAELTGRITEFTWEEEIMFIIGQTCVRCGKPVKQDPKNGPALFCSVTCTNEAMIERRHAPDTWPCLFPGCTTSFESDRALFCDAHARQHTRRSLLIELVAARTGDVVGEVAGEVEPRTGGEPEQVPVPPVRGAAEDQRSQTEIERDGFESMHAVVVDQRDALIKQLADLKAQMDALGLNFRVNTMQRDDALKQLADLRIILDGFFANATDLPSGELLTELVHRAQRMERERDAAWGQLKLCWEACDLPGEPLQWFPAFVLGNAAERVKVQISTLQEQLQEEEQVRLSIWSKICEQLDLDHDAPFDDVFNLLVELQEGPHSTTLLPEPKDLRAEQLQRYALFAVQQARALLGVAG